jgi:carboxyl-terminal processing protease
MGINKRHSALCPIHSIPLMVGPLTKRTLQLSGLWLASALLITGCSNNSLRAQGGTGSIAQQVWEIVDINYVDGTFNNQDWKAVRERFTSQPAKTLEQSYENVRKMLETLGDPYTRFLDAEQYKAIQTLGSGELSGVGLIVGLDNDTKQIVVISPVDGTPASRAGIKARDAIVKVDDKPTKSMTLDQVANLLRGRKGSKVTLVLERDKKDFTITLQRDRIEVDPVTAAVKEDKGFKVGYARLSTFNGNAVAKMSKAIQEEKAKGVDGYIMDLRANSGGLFGAGIDIARLWLDKDQVIIKTVSRQGVQDVVRSETPSLTDKPLVVLVDGGTASSSEILAGALQDNKRAILVGTKTFGKGVIQQVYTLNNSETTKIGLAVTVAKYQTPLGTDIHKKGIKPDVSVELSKDFTADQIATRKDSQYAKALEVLEGKIVAQKTGKQVVVGS